jgi:hypothetical protein
MNFHCTDCQQDKLIQPEGGTGYASLMNGDKVCYACIALQDRAAMIQDGQSSSLPLYLTRKGIHKPNDGAWAVTNWPTTLTLPVERITNGGHNIAGKRNDVWFYGPDGTSGTACSSAR